MLFEDDTDISLFLPIYQTQEIAQYLSIGDNYFYYVTHTEDVYFYKVYENDNFY